MPVDNSKKQQKSKTKNRKGVYTKKPRKNGRPKAENALSKKLIKAEAVKSDGSPTALARALNISPQSAHKHLQKPEIKKAVLSEREAALRRAGITRLRVYRTIGEGLDATKIVGYDEVKKEPIVVTDFKERRETGKLCAQLFGDLSPDNSGNLPPAPFLIFLPPPKEVIDVDAAT